MKIKLTCSIIVLSIIFLCCEKTNAQAPNWQWAKSAGGTAHDWGRSVATDASGNVFMTGYFESPSITFGTITLTHISFFMADIFIVKYDASGNALWAKSAGGFDFDKGLSVATDVNGNVFMTGSFYSPTITFGTITLTNAGSSTADIFIVKYDASGNVLWAKSAGGASYDEGSGVATDASGNVFITGQFNSATINFGTITLTNAGVSIVDVFITKYDANGNVLWAKSAGSTGADVGTSISTDTSGNVFMTGNFRSPTITFGSITLTHTGTTMYNDIFIVKYDASGNVLWAKSAGGTSYDEGYSVSTDVSGNVFMTGKINSPTITFGTITLTTASALGSGDIFIVKYDTSGNVLWAKSAGGGTSDQGYSVSTDASGNVFITGSFWSPTISFGTITLTNAGSCDIFIVKYDANGNVLWAKSVGGVSNDEGLSVSTDANGNVFIAGSSRSPTISFGTTTLTIASAIYVDIFIAKLDTVLVTGGNEIETSDNGVLLFPNPANNHLTIALASNYKKTEVTITDITGKIIYSATESAMQKMEVSTKDFASGVYLVQIQTTDFIETKKLIVKN